tara:strand:- start:1328 stop:1540 length:213 start_codon:yes stop_codon:yes gene_type:complete
MTEKVMAERAEQEGVQALLAAQLRIASLEEELAKVQKELGQRVLDQANSQAQKFLSSLTVGTTEAPFPPS